MKIYQELLQQITDKMSRFGMAMQPSCSQTDLKTLRSNSIRKLGHFAPEGYIDFLAITNGLDWNGIVVYASEQAPIVGFSNRFIAGFIDVNIAYREFEPMKDYLIFAGDGNFLFAYNISDSNYQILTTVGLTLLETFGSFDELLSNALQGHL